MKNYLIYKQCIVNGNDPFYSEANQSRLIEAAKRIEAGNGIEHDLIEVDDFAKNKQC